jgi:hypothetical protein
MGIGKYLINDHAALPSLEGWEVRFLQEKVPRQSILNYWIILLFRFIANFVIASAGQQKRRRSG